MHWRELKLEIDACVPERARVSEQRPILYIDCRRQQLHRIEFTATNNCSYPISTAKNGTGNRVDSFKTPCGIHRIEQMIGGDQPRGMIFEGREPTGEVACNLDNQQRDEITSRILWLDGLQVGVNREGSNDTFSRYIYIHGTSDEKRIGTAVSAGCIRMKNDDVIELFDAVRVGDLVIIR